MRLVCQNLTDDKFVFKRKRLTNDIGQTITIREEAYKKLLEIKREKGSFSQLFERLVEDREPLDILAELRAVSNSKKRKT